MEIYASNRLATLGHPQRLSIFRLLMRRYPDCVPAGDIADALGIKGSTLSSYLSALLRDGLITQERRGTSLLYAPSLETVRATFDYLVHDCGRGRADVLSGTILERPAEIGIEAPRVSKRVLFVCTGNSARSLLAEALLRDLGGNRFEVYSAGTQPRTAPNPFALQLLKDHGHDIDVLFSKGVSNYRGIDALAFDFVLTVCDRAANEDGPAWQGRPINAHWGIPDPAKPEGSDAELVHAFRQAYGALRNRILTFTQLPIEMLDRGALQRAVDDIGRMPREVSP